MNFKGKDILIVGFGVSGQAVARFLMHRGARVTVTDAGYPSQTGGGATAFPPDLRNLTFYFGGHPPEAFRGRDLIVLSPGVPTDLPELRKARRRGVPILGEFGLAVGLLRSPMIAVTGTNGKSTTVTLIDLMLRKAKKKVALGGNIGTPLMEIAEENKKFDWVVAEVSSYQLETCPKVFRPKIAVVLNITEDHMDRYPSFAAYAKAKFRIFRDQGPRDTLVYNGADPVVARGVRRARARKIDFTRETQSLDGMKLVGLHNRDNMRAAMATARVAGASPRSIRETVETFTGLPHRVQFVREAAGVRYYDDSKGTNVDAAVKSLEGFEDGRVILIAGGRGKGGSYAPLRRAARRKAKAVIVIGEAAPVLAKALKGAVEVVSAGRLETAVAEARRRARSGDIVLLSPACSSFDQFRDYKDRGERFAKLVRAL